MKVFFDECVPRPLRLWLPGHSIKTAQQMGWAQQENGALLILAEQEFDVFVTTDNNLSYQQNLTGRKIAILVLSTNHWPSIRPKTAMIAAAIAQIRPGEFRELSF